MQKLAKESPSGHHGTTLSGYIFTIKARIDNRKKQWVSVRSHMWLRFCHWVSKHQHIYRNVATYLPPGLPASTVTQSRCWPLVNCVIKNGKNVASGPQVALCFTGKYIATGAQRVKQQYLMSPQYELRPTSGWDWSGSLGHPS